MEDYEDKDEIDSEEYLKPFIGDQGWDSVDEDDEDLTLF